MATSRPAVLTICPKRDPTTEDIITVIEELPGGAKSEPETLRDVPGAMAPQNLQETRQGMLKPDVM
jgi:hypothetical protein